MQPGTKWDPPSRAFFEFAGGHLDVVLAAVAGLILFTRMLRRL